MNRRGFLMLCGMALPDLSLASAMEAAWPAGPSPRWRQFEITTSIEILRPSGKTRIWVPVPSVDEPAFQRTLAQSWHCESGTARLHTDRAQGFGVLAADIPAGAKPTLTFTCRVETRDRDERPVTRAASFHANTEASLSRYLRGTSHIPVDGIVAQTARQITRGAATDREKAHAIYEWIVVNTRRNPKTRGCGRGDIRFMLESGDLSGKCADLNALFVGLSRAAGLPARDVYGIRIAPSRLGYASLGTKTDDITKAQHCRAEVHLRGLGWVPVDPADVRKVMLEEPPGNLPLENAKVENIRQRLFGSWEMNWMAYNSAQDVDLPGAGFGPLPFFMYPQAETAEGRLDSLDAENFRYEIRAREIAGSAA